MEKTLLNIEKRLASSKPMSPKLQVIVSNIYNTIFSQHRWVVKHGKPDKDIQEHLDGLLKEYNEEVKNGHKN